MHFLRLRFLRCWTSKKTALPFRMGTAELFHRDSVEISYCNVSGRGAKASLPDIALS